MTRGKQSLAQLQVQGEQEQGERGGPNVDALGSVISAGAWVLLEAGRTGQAGSHSRRARNPPDGDGEVDQRLPTPQLPKGRTSKWKLGRLKLSKGNLENWGWGTQG